MLTSNGKGRIPGPAGDILPDSKLSFSHHRLSGSQNSDEDPDSNGDEFGGNNSSQSNAWRSMIATLRDELPPTTLLAELSKVGSSDRKVPRLAVSVVCLESIYDAYATFRDDSGFMQGTIHRKVMELQHGQIEIGAVLVLRNVSVFSPKPSDHFLNICPANIEHVFTESSQSDICKSNVELDAVCSSGLDSCHFPRPRYDISPLKNQRLVRRRTEGQPIEQEPDRLAQRTPNLILPSSVQNTNDVLGFFAKPVNFELKPSPCSSTTLVCRPSESTSPLKQRQQDDFEIRTPSASTMAGGSFQLDSRTTSPATRSNGFGTGVESPNPPASLDAVPLYGLELRSTRQSQPAKLAFVPSTPSGCSQTVELPDIDMDLLEESALDL